MKLLKILIITIIFSFISSISMSGEKKDCDKESSWYKKMTCKIDNATEGITSRKSLMQKPSED